MLRLASRVSPVFLAMLCACAQPALEPMAEDVDQSTGVSVARLARPIELVAASNPGMNDPFAYVAPFQTNRMGERALYIWMASQVQTPDPGPALIVDGQPLEIGEPQQSLEAMELSKPPYARPAPWSLERYYRINRAAVERLANASRLELVVRDPEGGEVRYVTEGTALQSLTAFVANLQ
jgi:hypothetical protein